MYFSMEYRTEKWKFFFCTISEVMFNGPYFVGFRNMSGFDPIIHVWPCLMHLLHVVPVPQHANLDKASTLNVGGVHFECEVWIESCWLDVPVSFKVKYLSY